MAVDDDDDETKTSQTNQEVSDFDEKRELLNTRNLEKISSDLQVKLESDYDSFEEPDFVIEKSEPKDQNEYDSSISGGFQFAQAKEENEYDSSISGGFQFAQVKEENEYDSCINT